MDERTNESLLSLFFFFLERHSVRFTRPYRVKNTVRKDVKQSAGTVFCTQGVCVYVFFFLHSQ